MSSPAQNSHIFINYVIQEEYAGLARCEIVDRFRSQLAQFISEEKVIQRPGFVPGTVEFAADLYVFTPEEFERVVSRELEIRLNAAK